MTNRKRISVLIFVMVALLPFHTARAADDKVRTTLNLVYAQVGERKLHVDLYVPPKSVNANPPLVVWIHGGGWRAGNKRPCPAVYLMLRGYAVASVEYRFSQEAIYPAQAHDVKAAIRYLRGTAGEHGYDATRIGVMGASAGGHLSMLLGTSADVAELEGDLGEHDEASSRVQAVVNLFGPSDLADYVAKAKPNAKRPNLVLQLLGGDIDKAKRLAPSASPMHFVGKGDAPLLSLHGDRDRLVPIDQSERMHEAYKGKGLDATFVPIKGAGHGGGQFASKAMQQRITKFFDERIRAK